MAGNSRTFISPQLKENIVRGFHDDHLTVSELARRYNCAYNTVNKIVKLTNYGFWDFAPGRQIDPPVTETRKNVSSSERAGLLMHDAMAVVELTLQGMVTMLKDHLTSITATQLCAFLTAVAPYTMIKKDKQKEPTKINVYKMFKDSLNNGIS